MDYDVQKTGMRLMTAVKKLHGIPEIPKYSMYVCMSNPLYFISSMLQNQQEQGNRKQ